MICQYSAYFANQGLVPPTIRSYLSALRIFQVILGFPDPRDHTSIPCLRLLLTGIRRTRSNNPAPSRQQLPITPDILTQIDRLWNMSPWTHEKHLLWATVSVCFFRMFRAGELTVSDVASFNPNTHLTWGDVAFNTNENPQFSKCTSCNQRQTSLARKSMFTSGDRKYYHLPHQRNVQICVSSGNRARPLLPTSRQLPTHQTVIYERHIRGPAAVGVTCTSRELCWSQLSYWCSNNSSQKWY